MGFESAYIVREVELLADGAGPADFSIDTDLPGQAVSNRHTLTFNTESTTPTFRPVSIRLPNVKGQIRKLSIVPTATLILQGLRLYVNRLNGGDWHWVAAPVRQTPEGWPGKARLPIAATPEGWPGRKALPLPQTPSEPLWTALPLDSIR